MPPDDLSALRRRLTKICKEEIRACLRAGKTDLETVAQLVEKRASMLIGDLQSMLAAAEVRSIIRGLLKRTAAKPGEADGAARQMELAGMEEFRGIPPNVAYEDKPGHVAYISYLDTTKSERAAALRLLRGSIAADEQKYLAMKAGNEFADALAKTYGDLPLGVLYELHRRDGSESKGAGK